jgi:hypothetical protein
MWARQADPSHPMNDSGGKIFSRLLSCEQSSIPAYPAPRGLNTYTPLVATLPQIPPEPSLTPDSCFFLFKLATAVEQDGSP